LHKKNVQSKRGIESVNFTFYR